MLLLPFLLCCVAAFAGAAGPHEDPSPAVVAEYAKLGGEYYRFGYQSGFYNIVWAPGKAGEHGWPTFSFWSKPIDNAVLAKLPAIAGPCCLDLSQTNVGVGGLPGLARFPQMKALVLNGTPVGDAGLKEVGRLERLEYLYLGSTAVTDEGLKQLANLKELKVLGLWRTGVKGPGLAHLAGLSGLQTLMLNSAPLDEDGLKELAGLKRLSALSLADTPVGDGAIPKLLNVGALRILTLAGTRVTDAGIKQLVRQRLLRELDLRRCPGVTDASVDELAKFELLWTLHVGDTQISPQGVARLKRALPHCNVSTSR
jgi:hypothetical protein